MRYLVQIAALSLALSRGALGQEVPSGAGGAAPIRTLLGDLAVVVRDQGDGTLAIGTAGAARSVLLRVRASDARRWADSVLRLLAAPLPRVGPARGKRAVKGKADAVVPNDTSPARRARVALEEPGVGAGTLAITRVDSAAVRTWLLFVDDAELSPLRATLEREEATTLAKVLRRASTPAPRRPAAKARRVPATPKGATAGQAPRRP